MNLNRSLRDWLALAQIIIQCQTDRGLKREVPSTLPLRSKHRLIQPSFQPLDCALINISFHPGKCQI